MGQRRPLAGSQLSLPPRAEKGYLQITSLSLWALVLVQEKKT